MIINFDYYKDVYKGVIDDEDRFNFLNQNAELVLSLITHKRIYEPNIMSEDDIHRAVCMEIDFLDKCDADFESLYEGLVNSFTVGKVSVSKDLSILGKKSPYLPMIVQAILNQYGLLYRGVCAC